MMIEVTALDLFRNFDELVRRIEEYRRAVDAERDAELAWRRRRAIDGAKAQTRRWLDR
ncbi:hypothetical protein FOB82_03815 [Corynebacterium xerosis]|uniref:Uncharacterized protein n=1 Tax=Corynebacterium xerosis TaxID=1725 RepID=A0A6B8TE19_9CORY|nr:hypothetical protein [Corynebacterium xerosis]QGS34198.1 hypothetical protein FOB82_03815 [Corynebacterium xerosis]